MRPVLHSYELLILEPPETFSYKSDNNDTMICGVEDMPSTSRNAE